LFGLWVARLHCQSETFNNTLLFEYLICFFMMNELI
jgi:hypothetical protein